MIVRSIMQFPTKTLETFDWFNDYRDTRAWCVENAPSLVQKLDTGYQKYLQGRNNDHKGT